ncbi:MAG TPA: hypothetical protein RMH85_04830 [Polyangiaceae bacterium LLY-WYZ-15_(1-7)]|nr:hypothetical protein [Myxococcales bacterium]MAT26458.1 hypothetical protein [Sandaracinus sp.]HJK93846.1 hypothetical protein [Polyangiaceae bacterium LLY-WYZ-15_(1-7)]MBJ75004.1 hypothetical protein [Sandaracinus sp.]HJL03664.1 hypothetical protein [Polyangiaceae bacterium LLY-WYZ-15_(1-7)]
MKRPGLAKATRGATWRRRGGEALTREAEELLFALAERMSEGSVREAGAQPTYFGSTMFTIDLETFSARWRGGLDAEGRERLRASVEGSVRVRLRAMRIACADAAHRVPDRGFGTALVETQVSLRGDQLHLDVDVEVPLDVSSTGTAR